MPLANHATLSEVNDSLLVDSPMNIVVRFLHSEVIFTRLEDHSMRLEDRFTRLEDLSTAIEACKIAFCGFLKQK